MADWLSYPATAQRGSLRALASDILGLREQAEGSGPEQRGQRRMATRILTLIDEKLVELGGLPCNYDDGESDSADDIDKDLRA